MRDRRATSRRQWSHRFQAFAAKASSFAGHSAAFTIAVLVTVSWAVSGPLFHFSDTWQLAINTGTTVFTFLMVFLIQNTMNRENAALHVKLDELIRVTAEARDALIGAERLDEEDLREFSEEERAADPERRAEGVWGPEHEGTMGAHDHGAPDPPGSPPGNARAGRTR